MQIHYPLNHHPLSLFHLSVFIHPEKNPNFFSHTVAISKHVKQDDVSHRWHKNYYSETWLMEMAMTWVDPTQYKMRAEMRQTKTL